MLRRIEKKKILIVDDDCCIRKVCRDVLSSSGYETSEAQDGHEALQRLKEEAFELVVADVRMPGMDGIALYNQAIKGCEYLKERFLFITGDISEDLLLTFRQLNLKYLWKPFKMIDLVNCVDALTMKNRGGDNQRRSFFRQEARMPLQKDCEVTTVDGKNIHNSRAVNLSKSGIGLRYQGAPLLRASMVDVSITLGRLSLERRCSVVWSRPVNLDNALAGLRLREAVPVEVFASLRMFESEKSNHAENSFTAAR